VSRLPRVAVIGAGNWGKNHVRVFNRLGALQAVAEQSPELCKNLKAQYPKAAVVEDYTALLADPAIDAVVVATPAPTHARIAVEALEAGKDVLVEKPMALSVEEADLMAETASKHQRVLMVGHLLLYKPAVQKIIEIVQSGLLGELYLVDMRRIKLGKVRHEENVLWSFAPHDLAVLLHLVESSVSSVDAWGSAFLQPSIEDDYHVQIAFENGVQAHLHSSWLWPEDERKTVLVGSKGMLTYDEHENRIWWHKKTVDEELAAFDGGREELPFEEKDALEEEARHFLHCVSRRAVPLTSGEKSKGVIELLVRAENMNKRKREQNREYFVHESAYVDEPAKIGPGTQIWHFSHVMGGAEIGANCKIGQNVFIAANVKIGNNVKIQNNVSVYEGVILEDDVFCGPSMVFTNIKTPRSAYPRNTSSDYITTRVKKGASIGANATIVCGVTIGTHALVGAGAVVTKDVPGHALVVGNPAAIRGWVCKCGSTIKSSEEKEIHCSKCGTELVLSPDC